VAECDRVPSQLTDAAIAASAMIEHYYLAGGGSAKDLRTDVSYLVEAVLETLVGSTAPPPPRLRRRTAWSKVISTPRYAGPERRRSDR